MNDLVDAGIDLARGIAALPVRQAQVMVLRFILGLAPYEVAAVLGVCKQRIAQMELTALRRMRNELRALRPHERRAREAA